MEVRVHLEVEPHYVINGTTHGNPECLREEGEEDRTREKEEKERRWRRKKKRRREGGRGRGGK